MSNKPEPKEEEKEKSRERKRIANQRHSYPPNLVSNDTMSFDLDAWAKIVKCIGQIVNKYTGKGQTFRNFIRSFECITEPMSEGMYNQLIWRFIDAKQKEKVAVEQIEDKESETFLAQLFLAYELCPPTQSAINKKNRKT